MKTDYLIVDLGTLSTRIGYGGEEKPKHILPSYVGVLTNLMEEEGMEEKGIIGQNLYGPLENVNMNQIFDSGKILDFDSFQTLLGTILPYELLLKPEASTLILTEDNHSQRRQRQKLCEIAFEKWNFKSILFSRTPTLSAYSVGRTTGVILDSGESGTTATIVHDGFSFIKSSKRSTCGGRSLRNSVKKYVEEVLKVDVVPSVALNGQNLTQNFYDFHLNDLYRQIKESIFKQEDKYQNIKQYKLPDKQVIRINKQEIDNVFVNDYSNDSNYTGIHDMVNQIIKQTTSDLKMSIELKLFENIIAVGGNTYTEGYVSDLQKELEVLKPAEAKLSVIAHPRRKQAAWLGASILSSISNLSSFCIHRNQYKQIGITILDKKCP